MAHKLKTRYVIGPDVELEREIIRLKNGKRLTNKLAEKLAKQAIRQVAGRPSLSGTSIESPQLKIRVPVKLKKAIEKEARTRGETISTVVREVLQERFM
jgi:predicted HicB family RNase H-like nuclease